MLPCETVNFETFKSTTGTKSICLSVIGTEKYQVHVQD